MTTMLQKIHPKLIKWPVFGMCFIGLKIRLGINIGIGIEKK